MMRLHSDGVFGMIDAHIWLALWMTFYPVKFFGCCQIKV
jgi:hypothetical protein